MDNTKGVDMRLNNFIMASIGLTRADVPKFKECYLTPSGKFVVVAALGGARRQEWEGMIEHIKSMPGFEKDQDDSSGVEAMFLFEPDPMIKATTILMLSPDRDDVGAWIFEYKRLKQIEVTTGFFARDRRRAAMDYAERRVMELGGIIDD